MKKILVLLLVSFASFAQTEKGMFTAGNRVFSLSSRLNGNYRSFELSPSFGKLIRKNFEYGASLYVGALNTGFDSETRICLQNYVTKYFGSKKTQPFVSFGIGPLITSSEFTVGITGAIGVQHFVHKNISISIYGAVSDLDVIGSYTKIGSSFNFYFLPKNKPQKTLNL